MKDLWTTTQTALGCVYYMESLLRLQITHLICYSDRQLLILLGMTTLRLGSHLNAELQQSVSLCVLLQISLGAQSKMNGTLLF